MNRTYPNTSLLRNHPAPPDSSIQNLKQISDYIHIPLKFDTNKDLATSMKQASEMYKNDLKYQMLQTMCIQYVPVSIDIIASSMSEAQYICTGLIKNMNDLKHYGLGIYNRIRMMDVGLSFYTHFTSPIRRYADVLVHRILLSAIEKNKHQQTIQQDTHVFTVVPCLCSIEEYGYRRAVVQDWCSVFE